MDYLSHISSIEKTNSSVYEKAMERLDSLAKPPGSLGKLETIAARLCAISGNLTPDINKRCIVVLASDNGVFEEGVSSAPQEVTAIQTINILDGLTGVGVLAKQFGADLLVADVGVNADLSHPNLINRKIRKSTNNIAKEPAMTREEAEKAINIGIELVSDAYDKGYKLLGIGEMGICNTTTASAVLSALTGLRGEISESTVGRGAGLDDNAFTHKMEVVKTALSLHNPDRDDVIDVLSKVGGFDIAAMAGVFIGAASRRLPVVIDGFISIVAALCAVRLNPIVKEYLFASHLSYEKGYALASYELGLAPCLNLDMRLGEGSGCPIMFSVMDASLAVLKNMATFGEAKIDDSYTEKIDKLSF